jgi:site-specific DNA-adenine methylase
MRTGVVYRPVATVRPAAGYIGGKKVLAKAIIACIDRIPHETYAEPFVGMGGVFLRRHRAPKGKIINDRSGDVATFFRILQRHYVPFMDMLRWQITGRQEFNRSRFHRDTGLRNQAHDSWTDLGIPRSHSRRPRKSVALRDISSTAKLRSLNITSIRPNVVYEAVVSCF